MVKHWWWIMFVVWGIILAQCATERTAVGISTDMERCLSMREKDPPAWQCECVKIADERCAIAGLSQRCYADGWADRDKHGFEIARCRARREN